MSGQAQAGGAAVCGVILAAGKGTRMGCMGRILPKTLLPVGGEPLIRHHLRQMREAGITEVLVVVGHLGGLIREHLEAEPFTGVEVTFVEQEEQLGIAHALGRLEGRVRGPMLVYLGDIYYDLTGLGAMLEQAAAGGSVLSVCREPDPALIRKNFSVESDAVGLVRRVVEKPAELVNDLKGCGLYLFSPAIFEAIRRTPRSELRNEYEITDAIQVLIDGGEPVRVAENIRWDMNMTVDADLLACNLRLLREAGGGTLLGAGAELHPEARLERCVVGTGARVRAPAQLRDSLILPGTVIDEALEGEQLIVAPGQVVQVSIEE